MRSRAIISAAILILNSCVILGQDNLFFNRSLQDFASKMQLSSSTPGYAPDRIIKTDIEGSEYLNDKFEKGEIFTSDSELFSGIPMRFNAYHNEIEVMMTDSLVWILSKTGNIIKIVLNSSVLIFTKFISSEGEKSGYLSLIYSGKSSLYRRDYKVLMEGVPSNGIINKIPSKIVDRPKEYYIQTNNGLPAYFKTSRNLSEILSDYSSEMNYFIKKEKINFKKEADLIRLLIYYDSIN